MASIEGSYVSADGHVVEPADLWTTRMDKRFRDRAPRIESRPENDYYIIDGQAPMPVGLEGAMMEDKVGKGQVETARRHATGSVGSLCPPGRPGLGPSTGRGRLSGDFWFTLFQPAGR